MQNIPQSIEVSQEWVEKILAAINAQQAADWTFMNGQGISHLHPYTPETLVRIYEENHYKLYLEPMRAFIDLDWDECLVQVCLIPPRKTGSSTWAVVSDDGFGPGNYKGALKLVQAVEENQLKTPAPRPAA